MRKNKFYFGTLGTVINIVLIAIFISGCSKEVVKDQAEIGRVRSTFVADTYPSDLADTVVVNPVVAVNFKSTVDASEASAYTLTLKQGTVSVPGTVSFSGKKLTFTPKTDLQSDTRYTATIKSNLKSTSEDREHSWSFRTGRKHRDRGENNNNNNALSIASVVPLKDATSVPVTIQPMVTFKEGMSSSNIKSMKFTVKQGETTIEGTLAYSGKTATFIPSGSLTANKKYTVTVSAGSRGDGDDDDDDEGHDGNKSSGSYSWSFTTGGGGGGVDVTAPTVLTVIPANNATLVAVNSKATVTFSEAMDATTINAANFTLKQGTTSVAGTIAYSGTTATFTPSSSLAANTVFTGTVTTGAKDAAGNALASNFTWSFTTSASVVVDVTAPTVLSVVPGNSATSVAVNGNVSATFSEAMNASTISSTTFTLKQGSTSVAGSVSYSGTMATFNPSSDLAGGMVYTATVTTGATDVAGNAIAANYMWSFTTATVIVADVTAPTITSMVPGNNATSIAVASNVSATFSEAMNASSISSTTFTLTQGSSSVAGSVSYSGTTATFNPSADLARRYGLHCNNYNRCN